MSDIVDLNQKRLDKALAESQQEPRETTTEVVQLLACSNCQSAQFQLAHDHRVICAVCKYAIVALRWYDVNEPKPTG